MPSPTQQRAQSNPPVEPPPAWNPVVDSDFDKRFRAARATDEAALAVDKPGAKPADSPPVDDPKTAESTAEPQTPADSTPTPEPEPPKTEPTKPVIQEVKRAHKTPSENFAELRKRTETAEARIKQLESELQAAKSDEVVAKLKKENDELHERFAAVDLSMDPKFQAHYEGQIKPAVDEAKTLVPPELTEKVTAILAMPVSKERYRLLNEVYSEMEPWAADRLREINSHIVRLEQERSQWLGKAKQTRDQLITQQQQQQQEFVSRAMKTMDEQLARAANPETGFAGFIKADGNDAEVGQNTELAKAIFSRTLSVEDQAKAAIWAAAAPTFLRELTKREEEIAALKETISKLKAATPSPAGGAGVEASGSEAEDANLSFQERILKRAAKAGVFDR